MALKAVWNLSELALKLVQVVKLYYCTVCILVIWYTLEY